ncbi:MAG: c-type cytochrome [Pyrinomonadaceae bacterium]
MSSKFKVQSSKFEAEDLKLKIKLGAVFIFAAFAVAACVKTESKRNEFVIADSKSYEASIFRANCAICHGNEANGKEINGVLTPSLRYGEAASLTEEQIYTQIHDGKLPMPAFKNQLTESEIKRMVQFIQRDLQGKQEIVKQK